VACKKKSLYLTFFVSCKIRIRDKANLSENQIRLKFILVYIELS
jgi:hypothetical protein